MIDERRSPSKHRVGLLALLAVVVAGLLAPLVAGPASAQPAAPVRAGQAPAADDPAAGLSDLASCVSEKKRLLVLLLVDESGSLKDTDPGNQRVAAAKSALSSLSALTTPAKGTAPPSVEVGVGGFSSDFGALSDFRALDPASLPAFQAQVDQFATRNTGIDTDFTNALAGAEAALDKRSAAITATGVEAPCRAILLFTDGQFSIEPRTGDRVNDAKSYAPGVRLDNQQGAEQAQSLGKDALCKPGGVADKIRSTGISIVVVPLASAIAPADQAFLQALSTGTGPGATCGKDPGNPRGAFLPAADLSALVQRFDQVANQIGGGTIVSGDGQQLICQGAPCEDRRRDFQVDGSVARVHLLLTVPNAQVEARLKLPGVAEPLVLARREPAEAKLGSATAKSTWLSGTEASVDVVLPTGETDFVGTWSLSFVDPTSSSADQMASSQLSLFGTISAELVGTPSFQAGAPGDLVARLSGNVKGKAPDNVAQAQVVATIADPSGGAGSDVTLLPDGKGQYVGQFTPAPDTSAAVLDVTLRSTVTTDTGVVLTSSSRAYPINVQKPGTYPQVGPPRLSFGIVEGTAPATGELVVTAGPGGAGCVTLKPPRVDGAPAAAKPVTVSVAGQASGACIPIAAGSTRRIQFEIHTAARANGLVRGVLPVAVTSKADPRVLQTDLAFSFPVTRGVDQQKRVVAAILLLLAGLGLPLLGLILMNALTTRFQDLDVVQGASLPVVVRHGEVLRSDPNTRRLSQFGLYGGDFENLAGAGGDRRFTWTGLVFSARSSFNPFGEGHARVSPEGGAADLKGREGTRVDLDLGLTGSWLFLLDQDATNAATARLEQTGARIAGDVPEVHGRLVAFVAEGPVVEQTRDLVPDILKRLPTTAKRLTELALTARHHETAEEKASAKDEKAAAKEAKAAEKAAEKAKAAEDKAKAAEEKAAAKAAKQSGEAPPEA